MRIKAIAVAVAVCLMAAVCLASDMNMGTWKLNDAKSKGAPGAPKNSTVSYEMVGDKIKCTIDGVDGSGKPSHSEWVGMFDGKDYPVTGDANSDMRSYKKVDDHTLEVSQKKGGKVMSTAKIVISADGKTRTVTLDNKDASGKMTTVVGVYDKQ
jgi:hypothetical protein